MKKFKKALTAIMAAAMVISATGATLTAFADTLTESTGSNTANTNVSYGSNGENDPTYTVTIPADVSFEEDLSNKTDTVTVSDVYLQIGEGVMVTVDSTNGYEMLLDGTDSNTTIPYVLTVGNVTMDATNKNVITVATGTKQNKGTGTATLEFSVPDKNVPAAGAYSDLLTFTIRIVTI